MDRQQQRTLTSDEVRAVIAAAAEVHEMAPLAFRLGAEMGARRRELAALRVDQARVKYGDVTTWLFMPDAEPPNPDRIGWWWRRSRELAGIDRHWRLHDLPNRSATADEALALVLGDALGG